MAKRKNRKKRSWCGCDRRKAKLKRKLKQWRRSWRKR